MTGALLTLPLDKMLAKQLSGELAGNGEPGTVSFTKDFSSINDRTLVGEQFCAVPMEDWSINKGRLVHEGKENKNRVHLLSGGSHYRSKILYFPFP